MFYYPFFIVLVCHSKPIPIIISLYVCSLKEKHDSFQCKQWRCLCLCVIYLKDPPRVWIVITVSFFFLYACTYKPMVLPSLSDLLIGGVAVTLNYAATFYLPSTRLLRDPLETLSVAIPVLLVGHVVILMATLLFVKQRTLRATMVRYHGNNVTMVSICLFDKIRHRLDMHLLLQPLVLVSCMD